jgi:hypothetical protein
MLTLPVLGNATRRDLRKIKVKLAQAGQQPQSLAENLWSSTIPQIPYRSLPLIDTINGQIGVNLIRSALNSFDFSNPLLWFTVPDMEAMIGLLDEGFVVYYCVDDYSALPGVDTVRITQMDEQLTRRANQVFVTSMQLYSKKAGLNPTTVYSPHGVAGRLRYFTRDGYTRLFGVACLVCSYVCFYRSGESVKPLLFKC